MTNNTLASGVAGALFLVLLSLKANLIVVALLAALGLAWFCMSFSPRSRLGFALTSGDWTRALNRLGKEVSTPSKEEIRSAAVRSWIFHTTLIALAALAVFMSEKHLSEYMRISIIITASLEIGFVIGMIAVIIKR